MTTRSLLRRTVVVANPNGLHMRPATRFARQAMAARGRVVVHHGTRTADGKSLNELLMLIAMPGDELVIELDGDDAAATIEALCEILAAAGDDDER